MRFIIVKNCNACFYQKHEFENKRRCDHPVFTKAKGKEFGKTFEITDTFPEWCPLPDKKNI